MTWNLRGSSRAAGKDGNDLRSHCACGTAQGQAGFAAHTELERRWGLRPAWGAVRCSAWLRQRVSHAAQTR